MSVHEIDPKAENARLVRVALGRSIKMHLAEMGDGLAGFAIVSWDNRGECTSSYLADGPIGRCLVPAFVHDALNRQVAVGIAQEELAPPSRNDA